MTAAQARPSDPMNATVGHTCDPSPTSSWRPWAAAFVACGSNGDAEVTPIESDDATAVEPTDAPAQDPSDESAPGPLAVDEVPEDLAEVDVDLAQRIVDELDAATGALADQVAADGGFSSEAAEVHLRSIYTARSAAETRTIWEEVLLPGMPDDPGAPVSRVTEVVGSSGACVVVEAERDYSALGAGDDLAERTWTLALTPTGDGPNERNVTVWLIDTEAAAVDVDVPCLAEETTDA